MSQVLEDTWSTTEAYACAYAFPFFCAQVKSNSIIGQKPDHAGLRSEWELRK